MNSIGWTLKIERELVRKGIDRLSPDQFAEVEKAIAEAMADAWERGNGFDHGVGFNMDWME